MTVVGLDLPIGLAFHHVLVSRRQSHLCLLRSDHILYLLSRGLPVVLELASGCCVVYVSQCRCR